MRSPKLFYFILIFSLFFLSCSKSETSQDDGDIVERDGFNDEDNFENGENELDEDLVVNGDFLEGPYGIAFGDRAADFTLPLKNGDWNFSQNRSKDENYLFVFYRPLNSTSAKIWNSDLINLFAFSPKNVSYFFLIDADGDSFDEKMAVIQKSVDEAYDLTGDSDVKSRIHIVTKPVSEIDSWLSRWLEAYPDFFFGIDRFQNIRRGGSFASWNSASPSPKMENLYKEAEYYDYEFQLIDFIEKNSGNATVFQGLKAVEFAEEGWTKELFFSVDFSNLGESGRLFIDLEQICDDPRSCEWDRLERLFLCDGDDETNCATEIGRWTTTYGRSGRWLTDITPLKPLFETSGRYNFKFTVDGDRYVNNLNFLFIKDDSVKQPLKFIKLFNQTTPFDENHNSKFELLELELPSDATTVKIFAYITGHGNGSEVENCAEFCKFESVFTVNGTNFEIDFANAGTPKGCFEAVSEGVVPNQYGSWPYGRAGWCPGQDVKLLEIDVADAIVSGLNSFDYGAFLDGEVYIPEVTNEDGYRAEIYLSSYLVVW